MYNEILNGRIQKTDNLNVVVYNDEIGPGNGRHDYAIYKAGAENTVAGPICEIHFQKGPRNEEGSVSGVLDVDLLEIVRHRLQCFQKGEFSTRENACALTHIEEALMWMNKRKEDRKERGVLGKNEK